MKNLETLKLSPNFFAREFLRSETSARMGREIIPTQQELENLRRLCTEVLEQVRSRAYHGRSIVVSSGLRPLWLNRKVGGSATSEHVRGGAADYNVMGMTPYEAALALMNPSLNDLPVNQVIYEFGEWVHVSVCEFGKPPKRQFLTATHDAQGKTIYLPGIVKV